MVHVKWFSRGGQLCCFCIAGHAGGAFGRDIVCAAVSSAALMAANTVTEVCGCSAVTRMRDGYLLCSVASGDLARAEDTLTGLQLHLNELQAQYPHKIQVDLIEL